MAGASACAYGRRMSRGVVMDGAGGTGKMGRVVVVVVVVFMVSEVAERFRGWFSREIVVALIRRER